MRMSEKFTLSIYLILISFIAGCSSCQDQNRPEEHHKAIKAESKAANQPTVTLTEKGQLPSGGGGGEAPVSGEHAAAAKDYQAFCASCHGAKGDANTPVAAAMNPKPRDLTDPAWQGEVDDARIALVIKDGGAAVGLSPTMAPWGSSLSDDKIAAMVKFIRSIKK